MHPDPKILNDLVRRIVEIAQPRRIILFGSAVRDDMRPDSDIDILVVVPDGTPRRQRHR
jgi:predicted nucleotidyltransferase